jgi:hypothetical protein
MIIRIYMNFSCKAGSPIDEPRQGLKSFFLHVPRVLANPGLTLANAFGVKSKLNDASPN